MNRDRELLNRLIDVRTQRKPERRQGAVAYPPKFRKFEDKGEVSPTLEINVLMIPPASEKLSGSSPMPPEKGGSLTYEVDRKETGNQPYIAKFPSSY